MPPHCLHGTMLAVTGCGVLITAPAGAGKSQLALELLSRGHALVADDVVSLRRGHGGSGISRDPAKRNAADHQQLLASDPSPLPGHIALRCGLVVDVARDFGAAAVLASHPVHLWLSPGPPQDPFEPSLFEGLAEARLPRHFLATLPGSAVLVEALARAWQPGGPGRAVAATLAANQARQLQRVCA